MHIFVRLTTKLAMGCNQPPAECVRGLFPQTEGWHSVRLTTQSHLVLSFRMTRAISPLPHMCLQGMPRDYSISLNLNFKALRGV
jgi:hypothetical protein